MIKKIKYAIACLGLLSMIGIYGCDKEMIFDDTFDYYMVEVENIAFQETIFAGQEFNVSFFGTIGNNGCHSFSHFAVIQNEQGVEIEVWGKIPKDADICTQNIVSLDNTIKKLTFENAGDYILKIKQPNGSYLEHQIIVF